MGTGTANIRNRPVHELREHSEKGLSEKLSAEIWRTAETIVILSSEDLQMMRDITQDMCRSGIGWRVSVAHCMKKESAFRFSRHQMASVGGYARTT